MLSLEGIGARLAWRAGFGLIALLLAFAALGVAMAALYLALLPTLTPAAALGVVAGVLAVLAVIAWLVGMQQRRRTMAAAPAAASPDMAALLPVAADGLRRVVAADPGAAVLGALAAGYIAESRTGLDLARLNVPGLDLAGIARLLGQGGADR